MTDLIYGFGEMFVYNSRKIAQIPNLTGVAQISGMYARTTGGMVWRIDESGSPQKVSIKKNNSDVSAVKIVAGRDHLLILDEDSRVWAYGDNTYGQIGNSENAESNAVQVKISENEYLVDVSDIVAGQYSSYAVKTETLADKTSKSTVYGWGDNSSGQLGKDPATNERMSVATIIDSAPSNIDVISAGYNQVYLIDSDGRVWGEGENALGQLANGETQNSSKFVICGDSQIEINKVDEDGNIISSGYGTIYVKKGELADLQASFEAFNVYTAKAGANTDYNFKYDVKNNGMVVDDAVLSVPENGKSIEALKEGIAYVKVTENESLNKTSFAKIVVLPQDADYDFQPKVQAGTNHTITVRYDGSVWGFGVNTHGQLGTGNTDTSDKPVAAI